MQVALCSLSFNALFWYACLLMRTHRPPANNPTSLMLGDMSDATLCIPLPLWCWCIAEPTVFSKRSTLLLPIYFSSIFFRWQQADSDSPRPLGLVCPVLWYGFIVWFDSLSTKVLRSSKGVVGNVVGYAQPWWWGSWCRRCVGWSAACAIVVHRLLFLFVLGDL